MKQIKQQNFHQFQPIIKVQEQDYLVQPPKSASFRLQKSGRFQTYNDRLRRKLLIENDQQFQRTQHQAKKVESDLFIMKINDIVNARKNLIQPLLAHPIEDMVPIHAPPVQQSGIRQIIDDRIRGGEVAKKKQYRKLKLEILEGERQKLPPTPKDEANSSFQFQGDIQRPEQVINKMYPCNRILSPTALGQDEVVFDYRNEIDLDRFYKNNAVFLGSTGIVVIQTQKEWKSVCSHMDNIRCGTSHQLCSIVHQLFGSETICVYLIKYCDAPCYVEFNKEALQSYLNYLRYMFVIEIQIENSMKLGILILEIMKALNSQAPDVFVSVDVNIQNTQLIVHFIMLIIKFEVLGFQFVGGKWLDQLGQSI
ncbi:hypothetical protein SS50377_24278 [Spironucleus salmonicida]|uniref:Uncharacterized protein n=1 Tax=Spironucleus salmonicida TaxID=348837 RepID=V6LKE4_9EUKA|nr:hypothetical protein SS50377_24278 [Spironucleus salmonicida]|eukprot:EST44818.1 Hypothetical protein SS50377_15264 [Spironucleus salmonicida]